MAPSNDEDDWETESDEAKSESDEETDSENDGEVGSENDWEAESESDWEAESESDNEGIIVPDLPPVPATIAKPNDNLCDTCKALDLTPRRFVVLPGDPEDGSEADDPNIHLGFVDDIRKKSNCPLCRLVLTSIGPGLVDVEDGQRVSIVMSWSTDGPTDPNAAWITPQIRLLRPYPQKKKDDYLNVLGLNVGPEITMIANDAPTPSKSFFIRFIKDKIDFEMVRNWLSICRIKHGSKCDRTEMLDHEVEDPAKDIPHFCLIDVVDNCIIPAPSGCQYVALSYVWGRIDPTAILRLLLSNFKQLENPGSLLLPENYNRMPLTIRDAIQVVQELHMRYLWIDSLCIIQDDVGPGGSKLGSISKMDLVYGGAYLTIMAATGTDANAGLPGLHQNTRVANQPIEQVLPGLRLGYKQKYQDYIDQSVYYTRAWTYQEQRFTKRSLIFIGGQVVYHCNSADQWREDVVFEDQKNGGRDAVDRDDDDIGDYQGLIQGYSGLSLTFDSDIYHAFAGMTRYFKIHLKVDLCHGIPDAYFDWFLLWIPLNPQKRREKAPSWSWSGWIGASMSQIWDWYTRRISKIRKAIRQRTWIIWYQRKSHDSEECVRVWTPKKSSTPSSSPRNFYGSHIQTRFPFDCSQTVPTPRKMVGAPVYIEDTHNPNPGSGFLQFWTVSVVFKLDQPTSVDDSPRTLNSCSRIGIFGRDGRELGIVYPNEGWDGDNVPKNHEFILLCEARDDRAEDNREDDEPGWRYRVMLIEWHGSDESAWAERVSVGSIAKGDLDQALGNGPVWKEIILG